MCVRLIIGEVVGDVSVSFFSKFLCSVSCVVLLLKYVGVIEDVFIVGVCFCGVVKVILWFVFSSSLIGCISLLR